MSDVFPYEDIVNLPHPQSGRHPQMPLESRAAQFAPFAALTGHNEAIAETARLTTAFAELSPDQQQTLSLKLNYILALTTNATSTDPPTTTDIPTSTDIPSLQITYFKPDAHKAGGAYVTITGTIKKIEETYDLLTLTDGTKIPLSSITDLQSPLFDPLNL